MDRPSSHSQKVPYARKDGRKSLFSKMKESVRDVLSPSWLTGLVSTVKKESPPKTTIETSQKFTTSDSSSMSVPQNTPMASVFLGQTMLNGQPRTLDFTNERGAPFPFSQANVPLPLSEFTSAQLPLNRFTEKTDSVMAQEDTMSQTSDSSKSTSGCSSMVPQMESGAGREKRKASLDGSSSTSPQQQGEPANKRQKLQVNMSANQTFSRRLSDSFTAGSRHTIGSGRPAFNTTLFASPLNESSILGTSFHESSFYPGKTTFGGRSSLSFRKKKVDLNQSLPSRLSVPVKAFMKAKPRMNPSKEAVTSSTAKRILEALDKMPTPLNDARRIPVMMPRQWTDSPSFFSRERTSPRSGPPTQKLNISAQASISRNRQVTFASSETNVKDKNDRPPPRRQDTVMVDPQSSTASGKIKRDKSYHRGSASAKTVTLEEDDTVVIPDLKTDFTLPVSSFTLPKFSFGGQPPKDSTAVTATGQASSVVKSIVPNTTSTAVGASTASPAKPNLNFTFSSPIVETVPANKPESPQKKAYSGFQFSSPLSVDKNDKKATQLSAFSSAAVTTATAFSKSPFSFSTPSSMEFNFVAAAKPKPKANGPSSIDSGASNGGFGAASELKRGSVMDILGGSGFSSSNSSSSGSSQSNSDKPFTASPISLLGFGSKSDSKATPASEAPPLSSVFKSSGWNCDVCLVNNKEGTDKCAACQTPKPGDKSKASSGGDIFGKFKQPEGSWTCDACLIQNKPDVSKCVACQSAKPSSASQSDTSLVASHGILPGNWICKTCLIQNKKEAETCGACKAARHSDKDTEAGKVTIPPKTDSLFAKFKPTTGQWECEVCLVQNKSEDAKCVACQTTKPLKAFKQPPGDWMCDTCLVVNKETAVNCAACNYARPGPPRTQAVPSCAKSFSLSQNSGSIQPSSTGGFTFNKSSASEPVKSGFNFGQPTTVSGKTDSEPKSGDFKFDSSSGTTKSTGSGFKFGADSAGKAEEKSNLSGGFKFGADNSDKSPSVSSGGFMVGNTEKKTESAESSLKPGGFQFGKPADPGSNIESKFSASTGGFVFGSKQDTSSAVKDPVQTSASLTSRFSDTIVPFSDSDSIKTNSFGSLTAASTSSSALPLSSSTVGFSFSSKVSAESSLVSQEPPKPVFGGFNFSQTKSDPTPGPAKTGLGNFSFATCKPNETADTGSVATKRNRDDDSGEAIAKKSFSFGPATNGPTPSSMFQFGTTSSTPSSTSTAATTPGLFVFGQKTAAGTSSTSTGLFTFGAANKSASSTTLGGTSSTPFAFGASSMNSSSVSTATPSFGQTNSITGSAVSTSMGASASAPSGLFQFGQANKTAATSSPFNFGSTSNAQTSNPIPVFGNGIPSSFEFNQKTNNATSSTSTVFKFGSTQQQPAPSFGSAFRAPTNTGSAFGGNAPSTTPAFGATPPAFGSSNPSGNANPASVFGGFGSSQPTAPSQPNPVFQFGKSAENSAPSVAQSGFNFGGNPSGLGSTPGFNFSAQSPAAGAFTIGAGSTPKDGRRIKKAVRKLHR